MDFIPIIARVWGMPIWFEALALCRGACRLPPHLTLPINYSMRV